jgi:putative serine protease PepD
MMSIPRTCGAALALLAVLTLTACTGGSSHSADSRSDATSHPTSTAASTTTNAAQALQAAYTATVQKTLPSVVEITTRAGLGSGVIIDTRGDIVTNDHVVGTATTFQVALANTGATYPATLVGTFAPDDLAVIRVSGAQNMHPATFGDSSSLRTGDIVMAVGNPLGLSGSVTDGIVSALGRTVNEPQDAGSPGATIPDAIQTSAAINPGNSGGALVNLNGQLVGIPTLAAVDQQIGNGSAAPGIGFAIASNMVRSIADQLISQGKVTNSGRAALGVTVETVTDTAGNPEGAGITSVVPGGPAATAGLVPGEVITRLGSATISSAQDLADALAEHAAGEHTTVTVISAPGGTQRVVDVVLGDLASG